MVVENMLMITKQYKFCAAHRYWNPDWDEEKNFHEFGDDVRLHGHNYDLYITVRGPVNNETGFIISLEKLNNIVSKYVIEVFDHMQIEKDIDWFSNRQPSTENMVVFIWNQIADHIPQPAELYKIKLRETNSIFTEYYGEQ